MCLTRAAALQQLLCKHNFKNRKTLERLKMTLKTVIIFMALCVPFFLLTTWAIVDSTQKNFGTVGKKVFWMIVAATPFVGFVFYFAIGFRKGKKTD